MDYGRMIRRSWDLTWRYKFLWILGLFASSTVGSCSPTGGGGGPVEWQTSPEELGRISPQMERALRSVYLWVTQNLDLIALVAVIAALLGLLFLALSLIAQGAMAGATADLAMGRPSSLGQAWSAGLGLFWRYLLLWLLMVGLIVAAMLVLGVVVGLIVLLASVAGDAVRVILIIAAVLMGIPVALLLIPAFIALGIVVALAQRAIAVEDVGPVEGLKRGARLLRDHLGASALVWLISLALGAGAGIAALIAVAILLVPVGGLAVVLFSLLGASPVPILYAVGAVLALIAAFWLLGAVANAYFWNFWTLAYLNFTGRLNERLEVPQ